MRAEVKICLYGLLAAIIAGWFLLAYGTLTTIPGPDSKETLLTTEGDLESAAHGIYRTDTFVCILASQAHDVTDSLAISARENLVRLLKDAIDSDGGKIFNSVRTLGHAWSRDDIFVSDDNHRLLILAESAKSVDLSPLQMKKLQPQLESWKSRHPSFTLLYSSSGIVNNELFSLINTDLDTSLKYIVPVTMGILLWTSGTVGVALLVLVITGLSLISSLGIAALMSHCIYPVSATAAQLVVLIVMAIGTDYALFYISRFRYERNSGASTEQGLIRTCSTTGIAVFWSGITVAASLTGLMLTGDPILTSMAAVSIVAVAVTLVYTNKCLPAMLMLFEGYVEFGRIRQAAPVRGIEQSHWVTWSIRHPLKALAVSLACLLSVGYFCTRMNLGSTMQPAFMPLKMQSRQAFDALVAHFPEVTGTDFGIVLHTDGPAFMQDDDLFEPFFDALNLEERVHGPLAAHWSIDRTTVRYDFKVSGTSQDTENRNLVERLRKEIIPAYLTPMGVRGYLVGKLSYDIDQEDFHRKKIFVVIVSILGVSLIFLMFAFESIVVPIKAFLLNTLSAASAFGVLVLLFQEYGWRYGMVESFVPALLFSVLFGLSMDYHLLLLSRVRECVHEGLETERAVARAITDTYGVISGAAIIMTSVFVVISFLELPVMRQLGIGLACAVVLDATIIRCVLLPSSMVLLGERNWYMPNVMKIAIQRIKRKLHTAG